MSEDVARKEKAASDSVISQIVARLVNAYDPERIYLFGSMARGDAGPDSDYDFMIVMPDGTPSSLLSARRAYEALWELKAAADVLIWPRKRFDERLHLKASLPSTIVREGTLVYAA